MNRIEELKRKVKDLYESKNPNRADWADWLYENHIFFVADKAKELAKRFGARSELAEAAGMLHDIADAVMSRFDELHEKTSEEIARKFLEEVGFGENEVGVVVDDAMKYHGCRDGQTPQTTEGKVVATADAVIHLSTDFYEFCKGEIVKNKSFEDAKKWALPKIERDYNEKILFDEVKKELYPDYLKAKGLFR